MSLPAHGIIAAAGNIEVDALDMLSAVYRAANGEPRAVEEASAALRRIAAAVAAIQRHVQDAHRAEIRAQFAAQRASGLGALMHKGEKE